MSDDGGDVVVDVNTHEPLGCEEAYAVREVFPAWLRIEGFQCASRALRWVRAKMGDRGEIDMWVVFRRELEKAYAAQEPGRPEARARGATAFAPSWMAGLIRMSGVEDDIPGRDTDEVDWLLRRADDGLHAAYRTIARESGDFAEGCGAMPIVELTS